MASVIEVQIPHSGSVENVELTEWSVNVGDVVSEGDVLAEVSTDKVDTELESPAAGRVAKLLVDEGDEIPVGTVVALLVDGSATAEEAQSAVETYTAS